jgi:hypothetical protein
MMSGQKLRINHNMKVSLHIFPGTRMNSTRNCYDIFHPVYNPNIFIYLTTEHFSFGFNVFCVIVTHSYKMIAMCQCTLCHYDTHV